MEINNKLSKTRTVAGIFKLIICATVLCLAMGIMLVLYNATVPDALEYFDKEGKMEHTAWLVKYGSYLPPVIAIAGLLTSMYSFGVYVPVKTQKHKAAIITIVFLFTYTALLGYTMVKSPDWLHNLQTGSENATMFSDCAGWFFAQIIPFIIVFSYHIIRASSEKKELEENEE